MPIQRTRGTVRASKGYAIFRIIFGLLFIGLGFNQLTRYPATGVPMFSFAIGALFTGYGIWALVAKKSLGNKFELETEAPTPTERLAEITKLKTDGLISDQEYEAKRQEILKDV
jgi:hypothetical protein